MSSGHSNDFTWKPSSVQFMGVFRTNNLLYMQKSCPPTSKWFLLIWLMSPLPGMLADFLCSFPNNGWKAASAPLHNLVSDFLGLYSVGDDCIVDWVNHMTKCLQVNLIQLVMWFLKVTFGAPNSYTHKPINFHFNNFQNSF